MLITAAGPVMPRTDSDALVLVREFYDSVKYEGYSRDDMVAEMRHVAAKGMAVAFHQLTDPVLARQVRCCAAAALLLLLLRC